MTPNSATGHPARLPTSPRPEPRGHLYLSLGSVASAAVTSPQNPAAADASL